MFRRYLIDLGILMFLLSIVARDAQGVVQFTLTDLGTLGGDESLATDINKSGQVVGSAQTTDGQFHAFLYSGSGPMQDIGTLGGSSSEATSINDSGQVAGYAYVDSFVYHAFRYTGTGPMQDLGTLDGSLSQAHGISNSGQVVGEGTAAGGRQIHAFLYDGGGPMQDLWLTEQTYAYGVNNSGKVVGAAFASNGSSYAFISDGSGPKDNLGTLPGGSSSYALCINDIDQVAGAADDANGYRHAFLYDGSGPIQDIGALSSEHESEANGINSYGHVVGWSYLTDGAPLARVIDSRAFLYNGNTMTDLNALIDSTLGWTLQHAMAINDTGQIVGYGINSAGTTHAFLLTPIPEPSTLALFSIGTMSLLAYARRYRWA